MINISQKSNYLTVGKALPSFCAYIKLAWNEVFLGDPFNYALVDNLDIHNAINYERFRQRAINAKAAGLTIRYWREPFYPRHVRDAISDSVELIGRADPKILDVRVR